MPASFIPSIKKDNSSFEELEEYMIKVNVLPKGTNLGGTFISKKGDYFELECIGPVNGYQYLKLLDRKIIKEFVYYPYEIADRRICYRLGKALGVTMFFATDTLRGLQFQLGELKERIRRGFRITDDFNMITVIHRKTEGLFHEELIELAKGLNTTPQSLPEKAQAMAAEYNKLAHQEFTKHGKEYEDALVPLSPDYYASMTVKFRSIFNFGRLWVERGVFEKTMASNPLLDRLQPPDPGQRRVMVLPGWNADTWAYVDAIFINPSFLKAQLRAGIELHSIHMDIIAMFDHWLAEFEKHGDPPACLALYNQTNRAMDHPRSDIGAKLEVMERLFTRAYSDPERIPKLYKKSLSRIHKGLEEFLKSRAKK
jgi:hypothetical protein